MNKAASLNLDLVRWLAALMVFFYHFSYIGMIGGIRDYLEPMGHLGVIIFFVMSGFVIRYVAECRHGGAVDYLEARWARINSVFLPALFLTAVLDFVGARLDPALYAALPPVDGRHLAALTPLYLSFLYENPLLEHRWFSNGPLWSIAFEVWYYILFCAAFYLRGRARLLCLAAGAVLAGYRIILLMPVWLIGGVAYKIVPRTQVMSVTLRRLLAVGALAGLVLLCTPWGSALSAPLRAASTAWAGAGYHAAFLEDYVAGLITGLLLVMVCSPGVGSVPEWWGGVVRWGAGFSFALYAFHVPLLIFARATHLYNPADWSALCGGIVVVALCWLLSFATEQRKFVWRRMAGWGSRKAQTWVRRF